MSTTQSPYKLTEVDSAKGARHLRDLEGVAWDDRLTAEWLHEAITIVVPGSNGYSVGLRYIQFHRSEFQHLVPSADRYAFFMAHIENPHITLLLSDIDMLRCIPRDQMEELVRAVTSRHSMQDDEWVLNAVHLGVDHEMVGKLIAAHILNPNFPVEAIRPFARVFLTKGAGRVRESDHFSDASEQHGLWEASDRNAMWMLVPADLLYEVLEECAGRLVPELFFMQGTGDEPSVFELLGAVVPGQYRLAKREFGPKVFMSLNQRRHLRKLAAESLMSLSGLPLEALMGLPEQVRNHLAKRALPGSLEFLARVTLSSRETSRYFERYASQVDPTRDELLAVYGNLMYYLNEALRSNSRYPTAMQIDQKLKEILAVAGYVVGKVYHEWSQGRGNQTFVKAKCPNMTRPVRFVQFVQQRVFFQDGDLAIIDISTARVQESLSRGQTIIPVPFIEVKSRY